MERGTEEAGRLRGMREERRKGEKGGEEERKEAGRRESFENAPDDSHLRCSDYDLYNEEFIQYSNFQRRASSVKEEGKRREEVVESGREGST